MSKISELGYLPRKIGTNKHKHIKKIKKIQKYLKKLIKKRGEG